MALTELERQERFGIDLQLLRNFEYQHDRDRGRDLLTTTRGESGLVDLKTVDAVKTLQQALLLRFQTREGELAVLGHPTYGSRLYELIGEPNTETNRNLAKLYALKAIAEEKRIEKVLSISVTQNSADRGQVDLAMTLKALTIDTPFNLVFPFFLDTGVNT